MDRRIIIQTECPLPTIWGKPAMMWRIIKVCEHNDKQLYGRQ
ncbi:MAG: hypothetical protein PUH87_03055 [Bacteroidales bacterium]|nr:hypothetical protein [Bacteroidales bacterium]MDD7123941.1 hypothetical protein [Bacteroidales bacterium]MDY5449677.1 hypothetical protein [Prevotella sp.]